MEERKSRGWFIDAREYHRKVEEPVLAKRFGRFGYTQMARPENEPLQ